MTQRLQFAVVGGLSLLVGAFIAFAITKVYPFHNHDEPIIIDNGPIAVDFTSKGHLASPSSYVRDQACEMTRITWKDDQGKDPTDLGYPDDMVPLFSETIQLIVKTAVGKELIIDLARLGQPYTGCPKDKEPPPPPYGMVATGLIFEHDSLLGLFAAKKIKAKDDETKGARIYGLKFIMRKSSTEGEHKEVLLRQPGGDRNKPVQIGLHTAVK